MDWELLLSAIIFLIGIAYGSGGLRTEVKDMKEAVAGLQKSFVEIKDTLVQEKDMPLYLKPICITIDALEKRISELERQRK